MKPLAEFLDAFTTMRALVIGEAMLDSYLSGKAGRLCQEAPVPVVDVTARTDSPGGAANTAVNLAALGARTTLLSVAGDDAEGVLLRRLLRRSGVTTQYLLLKRHRRTLAKQRVLADSHLVVRFDQGTTTALEPEIEQLVTDALEALFRAHDAIVVSDYGYGILTPRVIGCLAECQRRWPRILVADSRRLERFCEVGLTAAKPNFWETMRLLGRSNDADDKTALSNDDGLQILQRTGARLAAVTLDRDGAVLFERGRPPHRIFVQAAPQVRAAGAGDTFASALALALAANADGPAAAEIATAAAGIVVSQDHTAVCGLDDLRRLLNDGHDDSQRVRTALPELVNLLEPLRRNGKRIVLTNGCFDILHRGHITYLHQAKAQGDVLVVGVNSDASIRRLKGPQRPINSLDDRLRVLSALSSIDYLVPFNEDTPHTLIEAIRPDVFVKGGDYTRDTLPEASLVEALGGAVRILPFVADRSTSDVIQRICQRQSIEASRDSGGTDYAQRPVERRPEVAVRPAR